MQEASTNHRGLITNIPEIIAPYPHKEPCSASINLPLWPRTQKQVRRTLLIPKQFYKEQKNLE
jgi:hypothetical protein